MKLIYRIYQLFVVLPFLIFCSIACALVTTIGCTLGDGHYWGYYPGKWWARLIIWVSLLPIKVEGREHLRKDQSYVFVSNHQGSFDIFIIYGFLGRNFKWMMKKSLRNIPFVGSACAAAGHIFVDNSTPGRLKETLQKAETLARQPTTSTSISAARARSARPTTRHARCSRRACRWWCFPREHEPSLATWACSEEVRSCWPTNSSCQSAR